MKFRCNLNKTYMLTALTLIFIFAVAGSNELFIPLNIQEAYENGTRSYDGKPGPNYWQNHSDYKIEVELIPALSLLIGNAHITYYNNSPDTLDQLVLRLYQNILKKGVSRDFELKPEALNEGMNVHSLKINEDSIDLDAENARVKISNTNMFVSLKENLTPQNNLEVEVKWSFKISRKAPIRMGQYSDTDFFIAYWYPQVSVYDDIDGWDKHAYQGYVEFYNDFGNYNIKITVPDDYLIWATGILQNPREVLQENVYEKYQKAKISHEVVQIVKPEDYEDKSVTTENNKNTWHYKAQNVPDFSFGVSNHYTWDASSVVVDKKSNRRVMVSAAYPGSAAHYHEAVEFGKAAVKYLSEELPGIPFPYPQVTTFCNGKNSGGMETPMMANNGAPNKRSSSIGLIFHEIAHNHFPFYMGTNERKYAWMDEGWATFLPEEVTEQLVEDTVYNYRTYPVSSYLKSAGTEGEVPCMMPSYLLRHRSTFRAASYYRPALAYHALKDLLGEEIFKKSLQEYIRRWNGKHPIPQDFFFTFEDISGENLSWFWKPWFYERGYPDLSIKEVSRTGELISLTIEKLGNIPTSIIVRFISEDGSEEIVHKSVKNWKNGKTEIQLQYVQNKNVTQIILGNSDIPDVNRNNNSYHF